MTPDKRRSMTAARKLRIWTRCEGKCWYCGAAVPMSGPGVVYDHINALWIAGSDEDAGIAPICADPCNKIKTRADLKAIAKTKRLIKKADPETRKQPTMKSRPFPKGRKQGWPKRPFKRKS